jgi:CheY-specific phosphatase CheX
MISEYLNQALHATTHVFTKRWNLPVDHGRLIFKSNDQPLADITTLCSVQCDVLHISLSLSFSETVLLSLTGDITHKIYYETDEAVLDVAGIITTTIASELRERMRKLGYHMAVQHPKIFHGFDHAIHHPFKHPKVVFPIDTYLGAVFLELCVELSHGEKRADTSLVKNSDRVLNDTVPLRRARLGL